MGFQTVCPVVESLESRLLLSGSIVQFDTNMGSFQVQLYDDATPVTVANFLDYVSRGAFDSTVIHRSIPDFVVQGGGFAYPSFEHITTGPPIVNEPGISNTRGTIAMAKVGGDPDSATSEWFFNLGDNSENLDFQNGGFTVFGEVIGDGMDVIDAIAALDTFNFGGPFSDFPLRGDPDFDDPAFPSPDDVVLIHSVTITQLQVRLGAGHPNTAIFADDGGTEARAAFGSRAGVATLLFTGDNLQQFAGRRGTLIIAGDGVVLQSVLIDNSAGRDSFALTARGGDGLIHMGPITVDGSLRAVNAPGAHVHGNVVVTGTLGALNLAGISNGNINIAGMARGVSMNLGNVNDISLFSATPVGLLRVNQWLDTDATPDQIVAPSIGNLHSAGDFQANIALSGEGARRNVALGRANIGGVLSGVTWSIGGNSGALSANAIAPGFAGTFAGQVAGLNVPVIAHGGVTAASVGGIRAPGEFHMNLALSGEGARRNVALGRVNVGDLGAATWEVNGNAGAMVARNIDSGFTGNFAGNLAGLRVFENASGNLSAATVRGVNIGGNLHDGQLVLTQPAGPRVVAVRGVNVLGSISGYDLVAGADIGGITAAAIQDSLIATQGALRGLVVRPGGTFVNTNVFAESVGNANLGIVNIDNGGVPFGLTTGSIVRLDFTPAGGDPVRFVRLTDQATFTNFIVNSGIDLGDFAVNIG